MPSSSAPAASSGALHLVMNADPVQVLPGEVITYSVAITNVAEVPLERVVLDSSLPAGVVYVAQSGVGFGYSPPERRLSWAIGRLEPGQGLGGGFQLRATGLGIGTLITTTVSAGSANGPVATASAVVEVAPPRQNRVWATPEEGGWLRSEDGRVDLRVPAGAVPRRTELRYAFADDLKLPEHLFYAFRLEAGDETGQAVTQFRRPLVLSAFFDRRRLPPEALERLGLFHLNEASGEWEALAGQVDVRWQRVVALVEHFSLYALGLHTTQTAPNFSVDRMTAARGAQTALYSRSVTYSYPFDLPAGRGGLTPALGLRYNSANHSQHQGHYSYVGHGWDLVGADYVQRDPVSGKVTLMLGGQAYTLECYNSCSAWFVKENPLIKVAYAKGGDPYFISENNTNWARWTVTTPDGVVYTYYGEVRKSGDNLVYNNKPMTFYWSCTPQGSGNEWRELIWERIPLTQVQDRHGNLVNYGWEYEENIGSTTMPYNCYPAILGMQRHIRAVRLTSITYNDNRIRIALAYSSRLDRPAGYDAANTWRFYTEQRLTSVAVQAVFQGQSSATTLRTYGLNHRDQGDPNSARSQKLLNLMFIEEQAGSRSLRTSFDYSGYEATWPCSYRYLIKVQNAFGGVVEFSASGGNSANSNEDCWSGNPIYWRPPAVTIRTERDAVTGVTATWTYNSTNWSDDAHGFERVWVTAPDGQSCEVHEFIQMTPINGQARNDLAGRTKKQTVCTACTTGGECVANGELRRSETDWSHSSASLPLPDYSMLPEQDRPRFVWAAETRTYESRFNNDGTLAAAGVPIKRTTYEYQPARQLGNLSGARQFGNLTATKEYQGTTSGFETTPLRANVTEYRPNESVWVITKPALTQLYAGNETTLVAETRFYYDNATSYTTAPTKGLLTRQETMAVLNGTYQGSKSQTFQYYPNGNLQWQRDALERQTTFYYDGWYQAYEVCRVNALNHAFKTTYYGVPGDGTCNTTNGSTVNVFNRFGQPEKQWDPNDALTEYRYDDLGWLTAMAVAPDGIAAATVRREFRSLSSIGPNQPFWVHQQQRDDSGGDNTLHTWTYYDGFGRVLQT
ncbi:MAG: DUF11 domain-containing protein, partial [Caldilineales bacterium]|nr:DUF11 domain-containing protein [Caldilineales bacterium]